MNIEIRDLETEDLSKGFIDVVSQLSRHDIDVVDTESLRGVMESHLANNNEQIVVCVADNLKIIGTGKLLLERKFIRNGCLVGHVEDVVVDKTFRKKGIGSMIIREIISRAKKAGCYKLLLECPSGAIGFYEKLRFGVREFGMWMFLTSPSDEQE